MDEVFHDNSAAVDAERMKRINARVGLTDTGLASPQPSIDTEKGVDRLTENKPVNN